MLEHVEPSQIPKYFGGTQTDENGDPKCMHKVREYLFITGQKKKIEEETKPNKFYHKNENLQICDVILQINWGGKVPKESYVMRDERDNNNEDFIDTTIKKGSKIKLEFKCKEAGCALK